MEGNFEFDDDDGDLYTQTRRLNILLTDTGFGASATKNSQKSSSKEEAKRLYGRSGKIHLLRCLQYVLKLVTPQVVDLLYPDMDKQDMDKFKRDLMLAVKFMWVRCMEKALAGAVLRLAHLYGLIFLAIRQLNYHPVYVDDMVAILRENKVPYISALRILPKDMSLHLSAATTSQLTNTRMPVHDGFYINISKVAAMVAPAKFWSISVEYFYPNVFSLFTDLELDAPTLLVVFHRIVSRISGGTLHLRYFTVLSDFPDQKYIGMMYLVIKLYFVGSPTVVDFNSWLSWLQNQGPSLPFFKHRYHEMDPQTLLDLTDEQTNKYCNWIYDNFLTGKHEEDLENATPMESRLYRIFQYKRENVSSRVSEEIPLEMPRKKPTDQPPLARVNNDLDVSQVSKMEPHLRSYFCVRYGIKSKSFDELVQTAEDQLMELVWKDGFM